jgi:hypothetical protein
MSVGQFFGDEVPESIEVVAVEFDIVVTGALEK